MSKLQFYSEINPTVNELVLVEFTAKNEAFFDAKLLEYDYRAIMSVQDATKKWRVFSWNKIVPLNKPMVATVEEVDERANIVRLSICYLYDGSTETPEKVQEKLMIHFNENKIFEGFIKSLCIVNEYNFDEVWIEFGYFIDRLRREHNDEEDENVSLWNYFFDHFEDNYTNWKDELDYDDDFWDKLNEFFKKRTEEKTFKIMTKFKMVSRCGVSAIIDFLYSIKEETPIFKDIENNKKSLTYDTAPYYLLETMSDDTTIEDHKAFIDFIKKKSEETRDKYKIYIDVGKEDYIGKKIF